jgi:hypothetical protein
MRMERKAGLVIGGIRRVEMIQQQKRIEMVERACPNAPPEPDTGSLDDGLRFDDA